MELHDRGTGIRVSPIPPQPAGQNQYMGVEVRTPWLDGYVRVRFPENVMSRRGTHFLDNVQPEVPRVSTVSAPEWRLIRGRLSYRIQTPEGPGWSGQIWLGRDGAVEMEFAMGNASDTPDDLYAQICIDLSACPTLGPSQDVTRTFAWLKGEWQPLSKVTPWKAEKAGYPWILVMNASRGREFNRSIEEQFPWWIADQTQEHDLIARTTRDEKWLVAVTLDRTAQYVMTNSAIPCLHSDPLRTHAPAQKGRVWRGRLYFAENDPPTLKRRVERERARNYPRAIDWPGVQR